jgi:transglutaminase-like putative cysteine protease
VRAGRTAATGALNLRVGADIVILLLLAMIGVVGLATSFDDLGWLLAGAGGLVVGAGAALAAKALRLGVLLTVALALVAYLLLGSALAVPEQAIAVVLPSITSLASLGVGAVWGWADILTLRAPVDLPDYVTVVPYASAWLVGLVGTTLAARWLPRRRTAPRAALLLIGPALLYVASVLLGTQQPFYPGVRGVLFAAIALVWLGWRGTTGDRIRVERQRGTLRRRLVGTSIVVGAAVLLGAVSGVALAPPAHDRFVLREKIEPPFQPIDFSSPLAGFRHYSKLDVDKTIFTVTGLKPDERIRLATMDSYDGHVWDVAGAQVATAGSGSFELVGGTYPAPPLVKPGGDQTLTVKVGDYDDVWIPTPGYTRALRLTGRGGAALGDGARQGLRYNAATGGTVLLGGLAPGDTVRVTAEVQHAIPDDDELRDVPTATVAQGPVTDIPDVVAAKATEFAGGAKSAIGQLRNIEQTLHTKGYLSHGTSSDTVASLAGHGADRMEQLFSSSVMVGDDEQYASAMALMARSLHYPARVVMGFAPKVADGADPNQPVKVTGHDVSAWVEVAFQGVGWVPFSPTPTQTDVPQALNPKPQTEPQPQVRQPPRSNNDENDLVTNVQIDDGKKKDTSLFGLPGWVVGAGLGVLIPLAVVLLPAIALALLKARRMRRRRAASRAPDAAAGAWLELVDRLDELGFAPPPPGTRVRAAGVLDAELRRVLAAGTATAPVVAPASATRPPSTVAPVALLPLARRTDELVFAARAAAPEEADAVWRDALAAVEATERGLPRMRRILRRYRLSALTRWTRRTAARALAAAPGGAGSGGAGSGGAGSGARGAGAARRAAGSGRAR